MLPDIARAIERAPDGIWRTPSSARVSYPDDGNRFCFAIEDSSFWFQHRRSCLLALFAHFPPQGTFFDVGGGNGFMSAAIREAGHDVVLIEPGEEGAHNAQFRGIEQILCGRLEDAAFLPGTMPAIGLFDVLEHIEDDRGFLNLCRQLQPPGGRLYLTVPSSPALWSSEDELAGHFRRYSRRGLAHLLEAAGYRLDFASYLFEFLILPVLLKRAIPYRLGFKRKVETEESVRSDHTASNGLASRLLARLCAHEKTRLTHLRPLRAGTSLILVARRSDN